MKRKFISGLVVAGWVVGVLAFAVIVAWLERELDLSLGPALGVGASVALIWVTRTYVIATKQMAEDQATLVEIQRTAPFRAGLFHLWEISVDSMRLAAEVKTSYEYAVTSARNFEDAMTKLEEARVSANSLSRLASDFLVAAGALDPVSGHGQMAADQSIALLEFTSAVMPSIVEAVDRLSEMNREGLGCRLPAVPVSFSEPSDKVQRQVAAFTSSINDELGKP